MNKKSNRTVIISAILIIIVLMILSEGKKTEVLAQFPIPRDVGGGFNLGFDFKAGIYVNTSEVPREKLLVVGNDIGVGVLALPKPKDNKELTFLTLDDQGKLIEVDSGFTVGFVLFKEPPITLISGDEKQGEIKIGTKLYVTTEFSHEPGFFGGGGSEKIIITVIGIEGGRYIFDAKDFNMERIPTGTPMFFVKDQGPGISDVAGIYTGSFLPLDQQKNLDKMMAAGQDFLSRPYIYQIPENLFDILIDWFDLTETEQERLRKEYNKRTRKVINNHLGTMIRTQDFYQMVGSNMPGLINGEHIKSLPIRDTIDGKNGVILTTNPFYIDSVRSQYPVNNFGLDALVNYKYNHPEATVPKAARVDRPVFIRAPILDHWRLADGTYVGLTAFPETVAMNLKELERWGAFYTFQALGGWTPPVGQPGGLSGPVGDPPTIIIPGFPGGGGSTGGTQQGPIQSGPDNSPQSGPGTPQSGPR